MSNLNLYNMFLGSENQFRYFFNVKTNKSSADAVTADGDYYVGGDADTMYLVVQENGVVHRTDIINLAKIENASSKSPAQEAYKLKQSTVTVDGGTVVAGQDYVLNIEVSNYVALGDDSTHYKFGAVHATSAMATTVSDFYVAMAKSLARNLAKEPSPLVNIKLAGTKAADVLINGDIKTVAAGTYTGIIIEEVDQSVAAWRLGDQVERVNFKCIPGTIIKDGDYVIWGTVKDGETETTVGNGKATASLEWFLHGVRGDAYREYTYPNNFQFTPTVDPAKTYYIFDIHYSWQGNGVNVAKSERTLTVVADGTTNAIAANFVKAVNAKKANLLSVPT